MESKPVNMMSAGDLKYGFEKNGKCPWNLPKDLKYFAKVTKFTSDPNKKNVVIMDTEVWGVIPERNRPLINRINLVISKNSDFPDLPSDVLKYDNLNDAIRDMTSDDRIEVIWIIGGNEIYKEAMDHPQAHRVYMTEIQTDFNCDTFYPEFKNKFELLNDHGSQSELVPIEKQEENGLEYYFRIYEKK